MVWWRMPADPAFSWLLEDLALRQLCHCPSAWVDVDVQFNQTYRLGCSQVTGHRETSLLHTSAKLQLSYTLTVCSLSPPPDLLILALDLLQYPTVPLLNRFPSPSAAHPHT